MTDPRPSEVQALADLWLEDIVRCGEAALAKWQEAHRNEETGALTFVGPDGPFYEGIRSVVDRMRDYHYERTRGVRVAPSPDAPGRNAAIEAVAAILRNDLNVGSYDRARLVPAIVDAALAASGDAPREAALASEPVPATFEDGYRTGYAAATRDIDVEDGCRHCIQQSHTTEWHEAHYSDGRVATGGPMPSTPMSLAGESGCDYPIVARALHPVSDATPDLAAAAREWRDAYDETFAASKAMLSCGHPSEETDPPCPEIDRIMVASERYDEAVRVLRAALASEPVPATPACICGRAVPVAGTCFDIDGAYWSGHGEAVPATGLRWIGSGVSVSRQLAGEPVPATGNPACWCLIETATHPGAGINPFCPQHGTASESHPTKEPIDGE